MKLLPRHILFAFFILSFIAPSSSANAAGSDFLFQVQPGLQLPVDDSASFVGAADISGDGVEEWVFASGPHIQAYHLAPGGLFQLWQEYTFEASVSAVHVADLDGDDVSEVIVSYDDIGILDVIGWSDGEFWKSYNRVYLWSKVKTLDSLHLSAFPFQLILAVGSDGSLNILRWNGVDLEMQWTTSHLKQTELTYLGSADFDLDGESDFAFVVNNAELQIFSPAQSQLNPVWTNFPWGGISASLLADLDGDGAAELITASPAGLLYAFEWWKGYYLQKWKYEGVPGIANELTYLRLPLSNRQALAAKVRGKLVIWPLSASGTPQYQSEVVVNRQDWQFTKTVTGIDLLGLDLAGRSFQLKEHPAQDISVYYHQDGVNFTKVDFLVNDSEVWIPLRQLARLFSLSLDYNSVSDLVYLSSERIFMVFDATEQTIWINSIPYKVSGKLKKINNVFALSLSMAESMFNFSTHWLHEVIYLFPNQ